MERSVTTFAGDDARYSRMTLVHWFSFMARSEVKAASTGWHWKMLTNVKAMPAAITTKRVVKFAHRKILSVFVSAI